MRVKNDFVTLPFGSEYSLLLKNLNTRRAEVTINIDGQDVLDGNSLVVDANTTLELEGFMKGMKAKNKFKFIKKTEEISNHRGDRIDDGIIRVEFAYEKSEPVRIRQIINEHHHHYHHHEHNDPWRSIRYGGNTADPLVGTVYSYNSSNNLASSGSPEGLAEDFASFKQQLTTPVDEMGITVKGSEVNQDFQYVSMGDTDPSEVIIIHLKGTDSQGQVVQKPITVKTRLTCSSCGKKSKSSFKFCPNCGTFLE
jgi:hypothetical protein